MEDRWINGADLLKRLNRKELLEAVKDGLLTAYDPEDCKKIVDYEDLLVSEKKKVVFKNREEIATIYRLPTEKELDKTFRFVPIPSLPDSSGPQSLSERSKGRWPHSYEDSKPGFIDMENITSFIFLLDQVNTVKSGRKGRKIINNVIFNVAKNFKADHPEWTVPNAIQAIREYLSENNLQAPSDKQISRIIKPLKFKPGKPGRPFKKNR